MNIEIKNINALLPIESSTKNGSISFYSSGIVTDEYIKVKNIKYSELLPPLVARKLTLVVKMGMYSSLEMLNNIKKEYQVNAIIAATGMGRWKESSILDYNKVLSPTTFIQSMQNSLASHLAVNISCNGYNNTYVDQGLGLEHAIIDSYMLLDDNPDHNILVVGADEVSGSYSKIINNSDFINFNNSDIKLGEGSVSMLLSSQNGNANAILIKGVETYSGINKEELTENIRSFLKKSKVSYNEIDLIVSGFFSDSHFNESILIDDLVKNPKIHFKSLSGESPTSSGVAIWMAYLVLENSSDNKILILNQYRDYNYSFILITKNI